jgi:hypothetical protein
MVAGCSGDGSGLFILSNEILGFISWEFSWKVRGRLTFGMVRWGKRLWRLRLFVLLYRAYSRFQWLPAISELAFGSASQVVDASGWKC